MAITWTGKSILEASREFQDSQPLLAAAELGVFQALGAGTKTAKDLAGILKTDLRATTILLDALAAVGLLNKTNDGYSMPGELVPLLSDYGEASVLAMVQHQATCAHRWSRLAEAVRTGRPASEPGSLLADETQRKAFIGAMHVIGRHMADEIVAKIQPSNVQRLLDVGGASGTYTIAFLRASAAIRVTLFDLPPVIELARQRLTQEGLIDRVDLVPGDFYEDSLPEGHDLVLLSAIIHQNRPDQNRDLYAKCLRALVPGGAIVIRDIVMDDSHTRPAGGALFAVNMLVGTEGGGTYSFNEIRADLESAGFGNTELIQQGVWMDGLIQARRPR